MNNKIDSFIDRLYQNKKQLIIYFICAIICSTLRYILSALLSGIITSGADLVCWMLWAAAFYPLLKRFVFHYRAKHIYELLRQIFVYTVCVFVLFFCNTMFISVLYALLRSPTLSLAMGGILNELLCIVLMWFLVFHQKI